MDIVRIHFSSIDSTNTWGKNHVHELASDKITFITADEQTAGRGRVQRVWESPSGLNIYASFCFSLEESQPEICNIPQILALNAAQLLESYQFCPQLKWPNDVLLSNKKIAGILAETVSLSDRLYIILGIGINVNMPPKMLEELGRPATSMLIEGKCSYKIEEVIQQLQETFCCSLELFLKKGFSPFLPEYRKRLFTNDNHPIRFNDNQKIWEGNFYALLDNGSLCLTLPDGSLKVFTAGEVLWT